MGPGKEKSAGALIDAAVRGELDQAEAVRLCKECPELVTLALLAAGKRIAEQGARIAELQRESRGQQPFPSTPSSMVPVYTKASTPQRRKKSGAKKGHPGRRRSASARIDRRKTDRLKRSPYCGGQPASSLAQERLDGR